MGVKFFFKGEDDKVSKVTVIKVFGEVKSCTVFLPPEVIFFMRGNINPQKLFEGKVVAPKKTFCCIKCEEMSFFLD